MDKDTFTEVPGVSGIVGGSAGATHTMLLKNDGEVLGTGSDLYGQLGTGFVMEQGM